MLRRAGFSIGRGARVSDEPRADSAALQQGNDRRGHATLLHRDRDPQLIAPTDNAQHSRPRPVHDLLSPPQRSLCGRRLKTVPPAPVEK